MDCRVVVEAAVPVYDVSDPDEAVRIAISKTGELLNPDLNYVEIETGSRSCPTCGDDLDPVFIAADEALVSLELSMSVFNVDGEEHASRIARTEIGQRLENVPLDVVAVEREGADGDGGNDGNGDGDPGSESGATAGEDDVLPEFDDLLEGDS